jgi:hypothetical protein
MQFYFAFYWNEFTNSADINIEIAKEIKKDEYRGIRYSLLQSLDILFLKYLELDDELNKKNIITLKQKLRDVTALELPNNYKDLLFFYPNIFKEVSDLLNK